LIGLGATADGALRSRLLTEAPVNLLTTWYNSPNDLGWITQWNDDLVPQQYAAGRSHHLIIFTDGVETTFETKYGAACGRTYPFSSTFLDDMRRLAETFKGPRLYVTMFTEFQTYACTDNAWNPNLPTNNYHRALKDRYLEAMAVFHQAAPGSKVSLGWGGWQTRFDNAAIGAGRSMFPYFADVMGASDFQSFQAMQSDSNVNDVRAMVNVLNDYGPVMLAHYKPDNSSQATFDADVRTMLTDTYLQELTALGLFAWSFMDNYNVSASETTYQFAKNAVQRYGS
jgi:hypothetical protein